MQNIGEMIAVNLATIAVLATAIGIVLFFRAIIKFAGRQGVGFFKAIPAFFTERKSRKATKVEDELIEEGLKKDRIKEAKASNYQGTASLKYFYNHKRDKQLKKQAKQERKNK